ncbi:MAG: glycosyltransferase [Clostridia bacterium]|nr:glycosyltransferase [Clostridia bacterium]
MKTEKAQNRVCFLLTHVPNPRMNKRIEVFEEEADVQVICTRRKSQNIWEPAKNVPHFIFDIDLPSAKHLLKRYFVSKDFQKKALKKLCELAPSVIYAESLDSLLIAIKYKKKHDVKIIFEVADLRENYIVRPKSLAKRAVTELLLKKEKKAFKSVYRLVVTSPKFYDIHYHSLIEEGKVIFIPNAPDLSAFKGYQKKNGGNFTVGFIGGIRYLKQMKMLVDAADMIDADVLFAGAGGTSSEYEEIKLYCNGKDNVRFTGRYNYNEDIAGLYGMVDCVFSVYDADNPNVRIALPNKLYEAVYCELPLIVAKNTYLSELVKQYGVGVSVSHTDKNELVDVLLKLKDDIGYYKAFETKCREHKEEILGTKRQSEKLKNVLR